MRVEASLKDDGTIGRLRAISDDDLLRGLSELLGRSRRIEWELVAHIGEVEDRRLYAREAKPSMFAYCTDVLHLSEQEAHLRIAVARASREHPTLLAMLEDGRLHLSGIARLAPHLTQANRDVLLARATHKSKRQIEELIAEVAPAPDVPPSVRKLPERCGVETATTRDDAALLPRTSELGPDRVDAPLAPAPAGRPVVQPLAPARYKIQFTAGAAFCEKLERLKALMRSSVPDGDLALIIEAAVGEKLERLEAKRFGRAKESQAAQTRPGTKASSSRYVPAAVRRTVHDIPCRTRLRQGFHGEAPTGFDAREGRDSGSKRFRRYVDARHRLLAAAIGLAVIGGTTGSGAGPNPLSSDEWPNPTLLSWPATARLDRRSRGSRPPVRRRPAGRRL